MKSKICVILAGGESKRMGFDKRRLLIGKENIIEYEIDKLLKKNYEIYISGPSFHIKRNLPFIEDKIKGMGPLIGIYSALQYLKQSFVAISCDSPFFNLKFIKLLFAYESYDMVISKIKGKKHYFPGFYSANLLLPIRNLIEKGRNSMEALSDEVNALEIDEEKIKIFDENLLSFANLNTIEDIEEINAKLKMLNLKIQVKRAD